MGITVNWHDEQEDILHFRFQNVWTWNDLEAALDESNRLTKTKPYYVSVLHDMRESRFAPQHLFTRAPQYAKHLVKNRGLVVIFSRNTFHQMMFTMAMRFNPRYGERFSLTGDYDDALQQIRTWLYEHRDEKFEVEPE